MEADLGDDTLCPNLHTDPVAVLFFCEAAAALKGKELRVTGEVHILEHLKKKGLDAVEHLLLAQDVILGSRIESHIGLPARSLLLPLPVSLPLSLGLS